MGFLESFVFGTLGYLAYKVVKPHLEFRREYRRRVRELQEESRSEQ